MLTQHMAIKDRTVTLVLHDYIFLHGTKKLKKITSPEGLQRLHWQLNALTCTRQISFQAQRKNLIFINILLQSSNQHGSGASTANPNILFLSKGISDFIFYIFARENLEA
jgi:hypothetical protein